MVKKGVVKKDEIGKVDPRTLNKEQKFELARRMHEDRTDGLTYRQIATKYSVSVDTVHRYVKQYLPAATQGAAEMWREHEIEKLDELESKIWKMLDKRYYKVDHGKLIRIEDENTGEEVPLLDDGPILAAADRLLKISERRSKMLGLDKPVQAEVTHKAESVDSELLDVLKKVQERAKAEEDAIVEAEVVEDAPPAIEGGSDVVEDR